MSRFNARFTITRTRTIVETAEVVLPIDAEDYGDAGDQAEASDVDFDSAEFKAVSDNSTEGAVRLTAIAQDFSVDTPDDGTSGLTPAYYEASPAPSGAEYYPVQVEPTPDVD